ncbi:hypothetical protein [Streptomyces sp. NBC_01483]|uniref:hypothetical protein n=1 Tax=Streptomyces sp. NBC_01483 TaxID=2903883 RepID=UPI002E37AECF|nr:hypothetical protein [Streptomyces sp. NBC_01483]
MAREYIGAGGMRLHLDEPLSDEMAKQVAKGQLQPAVEPAAEDVQDAPPASTDGEVERPAKNASVDKWRAYAAARGMDDAESATKTECQDYVQVLDEAAGE